MFHVGNYVAPEHVQEVEPLIGWETSSPEGEEDEGQKEDKEDAEDEEDEGGQLEASEPSEHGFDVLRENMTAFANLVTTPFRATDPANVQLGAFLVTKRGPSTTWARMWAARRSRSSGDRPGFSS